MSKTENAVCEVIGRTPIKREDLLLRGTIRGIYGLRNKITGKWYVGQSWDISERWRGYSYNNCKLQKKLHHSIALHGWESFETYLLEEVSCPSQLVLTRCEDKWMSILNSIKNGYNLKTAGYNGKHSEETKRLISQKAKSRQNRGPLSETTKQKLRDRFKGIPQSKESNEKRRQTLLGRKRPEVGEKLKGQKRSEEFRRECRIRTLKQYYGEEWEKHL